MGGSVTRRSAAPAALILAMAAALLAGGCHNPLTSILQQIVYGGPYAPTVFTSTNPTTNLRPMWEWNQTTGTVEFRYSLDSSTGPWTTTMDTYWEPTWDLTVGNHTLYVQGCNDLGIWSASGILTITIEAGGGPAAPTVTGPASPIVDPRPMWTWNTPTGTVEFQYSLDYDTGPWTPTTNAYWSPGYDLSYGTHTLFVQGRNAAGFWSTSGSYTLTIVEILPPTVTGPVSPYFGYQPTWTWDTPVGAVGYQYSLDSDTGPWTATSDTFWTPSSDIIGWHTLYVQAQNGSGAWSTSGSYAVLVDPTWGTNVAGGTIDLGDREDMGTWTDEHPKHLTTISNFWISDVEVTQRFYQAVMGTNPSYHTSANGFLDDPNKPVEMVSWVDAVTFCNALSVAYGFTPAYTIVPGSVTWDPAANGFRLPTEAEWEFAARGGTISNSYRYSGSNILGDVAWYGGLDTDDSHPVGSLYYNELWLYDMTGNVWEWCWDWYDPNYYTNNTNWTDPIGPNGLVYGTGLSCYCIVRGGGYDSDTDMTRNAFRGSAPNTEVYRNAGFRIVRRP